MSSDKCKESSASAMNFEETELSLGLPGGPKILILGSSCSRKRGFSEGVDLTLGSSSCTPSSSGIFLSKTCEDDDDDDDPPSKDQISDAATKPPSKTQVVGWPPVKSSRKNTMMMMMKRSKYVKVAVDGAPYLRKVDLEMYTGYHQLLAGLEGMFTCLTILCSNGVNQKKLMDSSNGMQYVPTFEDKDGDWMLVGDVPWKMFVESCKRMRLMKSSEAIDQLGTKASPNCSSTC